MLHEKTTTKNSGSDEIRVCLTCGDILPEGSTRRRIYCGKQLCKVKGSQLFRNSRTERFCESCGEALPRHMRLGACYCPGKNCYQRARYHLLKQKDPKYLGTLVEKDRKKRLEDPEFVLKHRGYAREWRRRNPNHEASPGNSAKRKFYALLVATEKIKQQ